MSKANQIEDGKWTHLVNETSTTSYASEETECPHQHLYAHLNSAATPTQSFLLFGLRCMIHDSKFELTDRFGY